MNDKVMSMKEAVSTFVSPGDTLYIGGAIHGSPTAATTEILRQRINHLRVITVLFNLAPLVGEGLVDEVLTGYAMPDERWSYPLQRAKAKYGVSVTFKEYSHFGLALALYGGYMGVPFMPTKSHLGSDMMKYNDNLSTVDCPFTGKPVAAVRSVVPDVGIVHVQRCDAEGNAQRWGSMGVDFEGINASRKVIITTEEIVDTDVIQRDPNRTLIPGFRVSAVVQQPFGAYPMHLSGCYHDCSAGFGGMGDDENWDIYMKAMTEDAKDWDQYLENLKREFGQDLLENLRVKEPLESVPIITGM